MTRFETEAHGNSEMAYCYIVLSLGRLGTRHGRIFVADVQIHGLALILT